MPTISCEIAGEYFQLSYHKSSTSEGILYSGTLHTVPAFDFSLTVSGNNSTVFNPLKTAKNRQEVITEAVFLYEEKKEQGGFFP